MAKSQVLELIIRARNLAGAEVKNVVSGITRGRDALAAFNKESTIGKSVASSFRGQIASLAGAFIGLQAIRKTTQIMQEADAAAFGLQDAISDASKEFENIGSLRSWQESISSLSKELRIYSETDLKNAAARTIDLTKRMGLSKDQMVEVIRRASDLTNGNANLEDTIEAVSMALDGQARGVKTLGLNLKDEYVKGLYEADKANTKAWKNLTLLEQTQYRYLVFLKETDAVLGSTADSTSTFSGAMKEIRARITNTITGSKDLNDALVNVAAVLKENSEGIGKLVAWLVTAAAKIIEFTVNYKTMLAVIAGTVVSISLISKLVGVIKGLNAVMVIMTGLKLIPWLKDANMAITALASSSTLAGNAMKLGLAAGAAYGIMKIAELIKVIYEWRQAVAEQAKAEANLAANADRVMAKFAEFKNFKLPADITNATQKDLDEFKKKLSAARAFYTALKMQLEERAEKKTLLGGATDDARAAQIQLGKINKRLLDIQDDFEKVGEAASGAAQEMQKPAAAVEASTEQLDAFEKAAKAAYEDAKKAAKDYAQQVIEWEEKIKYAKLSTADKIRQLGRKGLTEEQAWNDMKLQADETFYKARRALAENDFKLAEKLANDAEALYTDLATEVKGTKNGNDVVVKSLDDTKQIAIDGVTAVGSLVEQLYTKQKDSAQASKNEWTATADTINAKLTELAKEREAKVAITLKGLQEAASAINKLTKDETKTIYIKTVYTSSGSSSSGGAGSPSGNAGEENPGMATGGKLPGYGGGDRVKLLAEAGEFIVRKEAVKRYGAALFHGLNDMRLNVKDSVRAQVGGLLYNASLPLAPVPRFAEGGMAGYAGGNETMTVNFQVGSVQMPLNVVGDKRVTRGMVKEFEKELVKMGLAKR